MKRPLEFRTRVFTSALGNLGAEDRAVLTATLNEIDGDCLKKEALASHDEGEIACWDICYVAVFNEGIFANHWSRPIGGSGMPPENIHRTLRRLAGGLGTHASLDRRTEKLREIIDRSTMGTIAFLAVGRTADGGRIETFWWHPSMRKDEALRALRDFAEYVLEERQ